MLSTEDLINLGEELRSTGFKVTTQQYLAAQQLLLECQRATTETLTQARLATFLAPIFCTNPDEQQRFRHLYQEWLHSRFGTPLPPQDTSNTPVPPPELPSGRASGWMLAVIALLTMVVLASLWYFWPSPPLSDKPPPNGVTLAACPPPPATFPMELVARLYADRGYPSSWWQRLAWYHMLSIPLPVVIALAWFVYRQSRRPVLQRLLSHAPATLGEVRLQDAPEVLLSTLPLRRLVRSLRRRRLVSSLQLDTAQTVTMTAQRGGLFTPVFGTRVEPEYLVIMERLSLADHHARVAMQVVSELARYDVLIEPYECDGDLRILRYVDRARQRPGVSPLMAANTLPMTTLEELQVRVPTHRLLLFCEAAMFFDSFTGRPHAWVDKLASWEERFVLTVAAPEQWGRAEMALEKLGFHVIPLSRPGLLLFSEILQSGMSLQGRHLTASPTPLPLHQRLRDRWLERRAPALERLQELCTDLEHTLGPQGFLWLCACAAYPEIHWGLTVRLGVSLLGPTAMQQALPSLARLVWLRQAFMPDWLRAALLQRLTTTQAASVRRVLIDILSSVASQGEGSTILHIATTRWWRRHARELVHEAPPGSAFRDYVFVQFLSAKRLAALTPTAPRALLQALFPGRYWWPAWRPWLVFSSSVLLSLSLACLWYALHPALPMTVTSLAWSPDSTFLVTGHTDNTVRVWDVASRQPLGVPLTGHSGFVGTVAWSPDGTMLASGSEDSTVRLWDAASRQPLGAPLRGGTSQVESVAWSPDSKTLAAGNKDSTIRLWDVARRQPLEPLLQGHSDGARNVAWGPQGTLLASGSEDGTIRLWDAASRQPLGPPLQGHTDRVKSVGWSPDGKLLASGSADNTIRLWDVASRQALEPPLQGHTDRVKSVAWNRHCILASGAEDTTIRLWNVVTGQPLSAPLTEHTGFVQGVAWSPDGQTLAASSADSTITLWSAAAKTPGNRQSGQASSP